jgi:uncharacterized protein YjbI with pentapeptide repeats
MDSLSSNTVLTAQSFIHTHDSSSKNLKNSKFSKQKDHQPEKEQILFRKQDGKAWVIIVREPSGGIKAYTEQQGLNRKALSLKGIPSYLPLENISKAKAVLSGSRLVLSDYQIEVLPGLKGGMMREENHGEATAPAEYYCAVTHELMEDPYSNELGNTYEKSVLEALLKTTKKDPLTRQPFQHIFPNRMLKAAIQTWKEQNLAVIKPGFPYMQLRNLPTAQRFLKLAQEFENENNLVEAEENYKKALKYTDDPKDYNQYTQFLGKLRSHQKVYKAYLELGKLYEKNNQLLEAKASYEEAKVLFPEKEEILKIIVDAARKIKDTDELVKALKALVCLHEKNNHLDQASENYEEIFGLSKERSALERLFTLYEKLQNEEKKFEVQKRLFELELAETPDKLSIYDSYKKFLKANGYLEAAAAVKKRFLNKLDSQKGLTDRLIQLISDQTTAIATINAQNIQQVDQQAVLIEKINLLNLQLNSMSHQIKLLKNPPLFTLDLSNNPNLTDKKFESILLATFSNVGVLNLAKCHQLTYISLKLLAKKFTNLAALNLSECKNIVHGITIDQILDIFPLQKLTGLTELNLNNCGIKDYDWLKSLKNLTILNLSQCNLTSKIDDEWNWDNMLPITTKKIIDHGLKHIASLIALTELNLSKCILVDGSLKKLKNLRALIKLNLARCRIVSDTDLNLKTFENLNITKIELELFQSLTDLTDLDLDNCKITEKRKQFLQEQLPNTCIKWISVYRS